jgi:hypothetical protein
VPPVQPSPVATADVEAAPVAPMQPEDDVSSATGRAGMLVPWEARPESWMLGPRVARVEPWVPRGVQSKSWVPYEARPKSVKQAVMKLCNAW